MKAKLERGGGFRGVLDYSLGKGAGMCELVGGNMTGTTARELAAEFGLSRQARPGVRRPVWHASLSLPEGETLDADRWSAVVHDFMSGMGLNTHQHVVIRHSDTAYDHVHIIASRIGLDGSLYHGAFDAKQAIALTQELEERHGLVRTDGPDDSGPPSKKRPTRNEIEMTVRTGEAPPRLMLQKIIDAAIDAAEGDVLDFIDRLEAADVEVTPNVARTGRMNGFSFGFGGVHFKGSDLGKSYTWKGLQERGVTYEQERDGPALRTRAGKAFAGEGPLDSGGPATADRAAGQAGGELVDTGGGAADLRADAGGRLPDDPGAERDSDLDVIEDDRADAHSRDGDRPAGGGEPDRHEQRGEIVIINDPDSRPGDGEAGSPATLDQSGAVDRLRPSDWHGLADRVDALAAAAYPTDLATRSRDPVTPAVAAKQRAWDQQHGALQAPAYRLTLKSRVDNLASLNVGKGRGPDGTEKTYGAAEVRGLIPYLSAQNARGRDIYLTPLDPAHHYVVVDDMTPQALEDFLASGYVPALVQESSPGNRQAILKLKKEQGKHEQSAANQVVVDLNTRFGDARFSGVVHPFRMAGFSNRKPGRNNAFTRIVEAAGGLCQRAMRQLEAVRQRLLEELKPASAPIPTGGKAMVRRPLAPQEAASTEAQRAFDAARAKALGLAELRGWTLDDSRLDYRAAQLMSAEGWDAPDIAAAIVARSPNIVERHRDPLGYASRTAENASITRLADPEPELKGEQPLAADRPEEEGPGM